jgi:predicted transcriptional regulator
MEEREIKSMLLRKTFFLFLNIRDGIYTNKLSKIANMTASHTTQIINYFGNAGLLEFKKQGRTKRIFLTNKGKVVSQNLLSIKEKLGLSGYWEKRIW